MLILYSTAHQRHAGRVRVLPRRACAVLRIARRAEFVPQALRARGHDIRSPEDDRAAALPAVHSVRYRSSSSRRGRNGSRWMRLTLGGQSFPSVWPVRTLRSDVEPANFIARLGLYSMDNGGPIAAGTWAAAKAGADAAATAPCGRRLHGRLLPGV
jgi:hypothetical protein